MKYLSLVCLLFIVGCDGIAAIDETVILSEPVVIDKVSIAPPAKVAVEAVPEPVQPGPAREAAAPAPAPVVVSSGPHWSYPGSTNDPDRSKLRSHLAGNPHYFDTAGWTAEQLLQFHDAMHVAEQAKQPKSNTAAPAKISTVQQYTIKSCGICKSDMRDVLPNWKRQGWTVLEPIDESASPHGLYPRYEIRGADGSFKTHVGSLRTWK